MANNAPDSSNTGTNGTESSVRRGRAIKSPQKRAAEYLAGRPKQQKQMREKQKEQEAMKRRLRAEEEEAIRKQIKRRIHLGAVETIAKRYGKRPRPPKGCMCAFGFYFHRVKDEFLDLYRELSYQEVVSERAKSWNKRTDEEKEPYRERQEEDRKRWERERRKWLVSIEAYRDKSIQKQEQALALEKQNPQILSPDDLLLSHTADEND